jgi:SAM-dependent methyltransferase
MTRPTETQPRGYEIDALRSRIAALEDELVERTARANAAVAAAEDRAYWLDRWRIDLNAVMRRRGTGWARAAVRAAAAVFRKARELRSELPGVVAGERSDGAPPPGAMAGHGLSASNFSRPAPERLATSEVTDLLYARLDPGTEDEVAQRLDPADRESWDAAGPAERRRLTLHFGVHYGVEDVLAHSGLIPDEPPEGVHAMARGSGAAGGSVYYGDLVSGALREAGLPLTDASRALDFGCSSGRVVRVLAAAYPEIDWHGADPIKPAIDWASEHLPGIAFEHGPERPPLPYDEGSFDVAFAISIWSHFAEPAGMAWLEEMRRIIRPGGLLLITTAGWQTLAHDFELGLRSAEQLSEAASSLYRNGFWFRDEFGESGDFGIVNPDWGTAFMTPDWLLTRATPRWRIAQFGPGRVEGAQDLFVLERR